MTTYRRGDVVVVSVGFTGQAGSKLRPALVVSADRFHKKLPDLIVAPISSQARFLGKPGAGDYPLEHWKAVGLRYPSTVRISNIVAVEKKIIKRVLGSAHPDDLVAVDRDMRAALGL